VCVYSRIYPDYNANEPYCIVICGLSGSSIYFPHNITNGTILGIKLPNIDCMLTFSLQFLSKTVLILRRFQRDIIIYVGARGGAVG